ncbi:hypothetical protein U5B43_05630 [Campylobacter sp. 9BO]|uniref:hypothetical protein n=1 Tax=Campylobacter sp. 9BO TaxID=3424759 RepID=UPI003D325533
MPNFSPGDFQGILNLNNATWFDKNDFDFDVIKDNIKNAYNQNDFLQNTINFRDSFCGIKHNLLQKGNSIDASNHHKAELYCKEVELEYEIIEDEKQRNEYNKNLSIKWKFWITTSAILFLVSFGFVILNLNCGWIGISLAKKSLFTPLIFFVLYAFYNTRELKLADFTKWFEYISLKIYRNTSEHHTNLNKIFHFTLLMIAIYGVNLALISTINEVILKYELYIILNLILISLILIAIYFLAKNISNMSGYAILFLICVVLPSIVYMSHVAFGVLFYVTLLFLSYFCFISNKNYLIMPIRFLTYLALFMILLKSPELINPTLNIFNKQNIENMNLLDKFSRLDYEILSNLTRLSFRDYELKGEIKFDENSIANQREIIIANKNTLENIFSFLFASNSKEKSLEILNSLNDIEKLSKILQDHKKGELR